MRTSNSYNSDFTFFFCFAKFCDLFLSIFNDLKFFFKNIVSFHEDNFFSSRKLVPFQMRYCILYCCKYLWKKIVA